MKKITSFWSFLWYPYGRTSTEPAPRKNLRNQHVNKNRSKKSGTTSKTFSNTKIDFSSLHFLRCGAERRSFDCTRKTYLLTATSSFLTKKIAGWLRLGESPYKIHTIPNVSTTMPGVRVPRRKKIKKWLKRMT